MTKPDMRVLEYGLTSQDPLFKTLQNAFRKVQNKVVLVPSDLNESETNSVRLLQNYDVIHFWRSPSLRTLDMLRNQGSKPVLIANDVFGFPYDKDNLFDYIVHISKSCFARYCKRLGTGTTPQNLLGSHVVSYLPIDTQIFDPAKITRSEIQSFREKLGISQDEVVIGRTGRADHFKWDFFITDLIKHMTKRGIKVKALIVGGVPDFILKDVRAKKLQNSFIIKDFTRSQELLAKYYAAMDTYTHSSFIGESLGRSIAEAMLMEKPVLITSKNWADNAPHEFVKHLQSGIFCRNVKEASFYLELISKRKDISTSLGKQARIAARKYFDSLVVARNLLSVYTGNIDPNSSLIPSFEEILQWAESGYGETHDAPIFLRSSYIFLLNLRRIRMFGTVLLARRMLELTGYSTPLSILP